ncbi:cytochrome b [Desulfococcus sp.]|uniref:cytochrome b n=1 Tax=Desulfococcus sp. TaxID=2025834 RepID=UPI0035931BA2
MVKDTVDSFSLVSRLFHWVIALMVVGMLLGGLFVGFLPRGAFKSLVVDLHRSTGFVILVLMALRLWWRSVNPRPKDLGPNAFENQIGRLMHIFLYILVFLQPLFGILMSQAFGSQVSVFGLFTLPAVLPKNPAVGSVFSQMHSITALLLAISVAIHAAAALKHHYIDRDRTLVRMISGK